MTGLTFALGADGDNVVGGKTLQKDGQGGGGRIVSIGIPNIVRFRFCTRVGLTVDFDGDARIGASSRTLKCVVVG